MKNKFCDLLNIKYPIIQAGMVWCSPWQLASVVSNYGGLGVIGAASMYPEVLKEHLEKCITATDKPFAVNLPLLYPQIDDHIDLIIQHKVPVVITSAGSPKKYTSLLKNKGIKVIHVVSSSVFAIKAQQAGCDAVIAEGFEAGGHKGREETTTLCLIPAVKKAINIPLVAAGGISSGKSMHAMLALGADGVQVGTRFVASVESSAHGNFKEWVVRAQEGDTELTLKDVVPTRMLKNDLFHKIKNGYSINATTDEIKEILGRGKAKQGMFEGNVVNGELEIGQISSMIDKVLPASEILKELVSEFNESVHLAKEWSM